ncbi:DUF3800 domain-containing protein [Pontibacter pamirensis]|uniref:DUF3800 domain-containing protein n=1 Tax=Pontibacter pamirensis TaxID=2562824 RepID=UPI00138A5722|nr:DUF3800 domain-containing protein [Pontibacter pamirensis]
MECSEIRRLIEGWPAQGFHFDGPGSTHFSVTVVLVLVQEGNRREVEKEFRRIRERHFPGVEIRFGEGPLFQEQRREFLEELKKLGFSFHALLVAKRKLHQKSPLQYKDTF